MAYSLWKTAPALALTLLALSGCGRIGALDLPSHRAGHAAGNVPAVQGAGLLGADAGKLSAAARKQALAAEYKALEFNKPSDNVEWRNAADHASGTVIPGQPYRVGAQNCRQYSHDWRLNGVPHTARGAACRNADGSWTPLN